MNGNFPNKLKGGKYLGLSKNVPYYRFGTEHRIETGLCDPVGRAVEEDQGR